MLQIVLLIGHAYCTDLTFVCFLSCVNDYIEPVVTFTAWVKICSAKYFCNVRVAGLGEIFVQQKFSAELYMYMYMHCSFNRTLTRFFPIQMEHLLADNDGLATSSALLNATTEMERKLSATAAQQFIKLLLKEKWLEQVVSAVY